MLVEIDEKAKHWIASKGSELTVKVLETNTCCAPNVQDIVAIPGKPKSINQYYKLNVDNLSVYIHRSLSSKNRLTLKLSGISLLKSVSAKLE